MSQDMIDPCTGITLSPAKDGVGCDGNGENPDYECCCDACDYYLLCFPDWDKF